MQELLTSVPSWDKEVIGFNQGTLVLVLGFFALGFIAKAIAMIIITKFLSRFCEGNELAMETIVNSRGALGNAAAAATIFFCLQELLNAKDVLMPGVFERWAVAIVHLVMLFALIIWLFRLVGIINSLISYLDDDGNLDASQRTLVGALESIIRFLIIIFGGAFIADALGFDLTTIVAGLGISGLAFALAAKEGIVGFSRSLASELLEYGININSVYPGGATRMTASIPQTTRDLRKELDSKKKGTDVQEMPSSEEPPEASDPENNAPKMVYLCTEPAGEITGQVFGTFGWNMSLYSPRHVTHSINKVGKWSVKELSNILPISLAKELINPIFGPSGVSIGQTLP